MARESGVMRVRYLGLMLASSIQVWQSLARNLSLNGLLVIELIL
jgi:hypothetical protein